MKIIRNWNKIINFYEIIRKYLWIENEIPTLIAAGNAGGIAIVILSKSFNISSDVGNEETSSYKMNEYIITVRIPISPINYIDSSWNLLN